MKRNFWVAAGLAIGSLFIPLTHANAGPEASEERVMVLIKFVPDANLAADHKIRFVPESCPACRQLHDPAYERFNTRESVLQFEVPKNRSLELAFDMSKKQARRVIINDQDVTTFQDNEKLIVALPPLPIDAIWAPALETDIEEPGMILRVEPADPARRAGAYAAGRFPELERRAADNLSFAQREAIRRLGLGEKVVRDKTGVIMVMGFDTNFPANHLDAPAHIHMHLRWPNNVGTQISHFYLSEQGLLTENKVGVRALNLPQRRFGPQEIYWTVDNKGQRVYGHTITEKGHLKLDASDGQSCVMQPIGSGFHLGVRLDCGSLGTATIQVNNDFAIGVISVQTGEIRETFRFDVDTGKLLSPSLPPPPPASARNPVF
jgi:hypothetical protein